MKDINTQDNLEILRKVDNNPKASQRYLAEKLGFSIGKINYCSHKLLNAMSAHVCNPSLSRASSLPTCIPYLRLTTVREKQVFDQVVSAITEFHKHLSPPCKHLLRHQWQARALQHNRIFNP